MAGSSDKQSAKIIWDKGTAYDFFASLLVLHDPVKFGLRGAWAAGVRSRLSQDERDFLEMAVEIIPMPIWWVNTLAAPKDSETALFSLKQIPAEDRITTMIFPSFMEDDYVKRLKNVKKNGKWDAKDKQFLIDYRNSKHEKGEPVSNKSIEFLLDAFADSSQFGAMYLQALQEYYEVFFAEEEKRIAEKIDQALIDGKEKAKDLSTLDLLEDLSRGVQYEELLNTEELILVPSYWFSPLTFRGMIAPNIRLMMFGARKPGESLVPGEVVPDDLLQALKALADPTRLRILRYLMQEQLTPAEISRRLRLRAPTVTHHLHALRLAGMVRFVIKGKTERLYFARMETIKANYALLKDFLEEDVAEAEGLDVIERGRVF